MRTDPHVSLGRLFCQVRPSNLFRCSQGSEAPSQSWSKRTTVYPDNFRSTRTLPRCPTASTGLGGRRDLVPFEHDGQNLQVALDLEIILRLNELVDRVDAILTGGVPAGDEKLEV